MAERRIGLIPHAMTMIRSGALEDCAILVTDRRTIIAFEQPRAKGIRASLKRDFEDTKADVDRIKQQIDFASIDLDALASMNENTSVLHTSIERLRIKKGLGGYSFDIEYRSEDGKRLMAFADIIPLPELVKLRKSAGKSKEEIRRDYAEKAQEVFKRALPPVAYGKAEWLS